jgi:hypothetical protein
VARDDLFEDADARGEPWPGPVVECVPWAQNQKLKWVAINQFQQAKFVRRNQHNLNGVKLDPACTLPRETARLNLAQSACEFLNRAIGYIPIFLGFFCKNKCQLT